MIAARKNPQGAFQGLAMGRVAAITLERSFLLFRL